MDLYLKALTAQSALRTGLMVSHSYERLEFLGDAVLTLAVRSLLMRRYPHAQEVRAPGALRALLALCMGPNGSAHAGRIRVGLCLCLRHKQHPQSVCGMSLPSMMVRQPVVTSTMARTLMAAHGCRGR